MESTRTVYILRSLIDPDRHYTGRTSNVTRRLAWHNAGLNTHTARHRPWQLLGEGCLAAAKRLHALIVAKRPSATN